VQRAIVFALIITAGCADDAGPATEVNVPLLFLTHCARCHGPEGAGVPGLPPEIGVARDLRDPTWQDSRTAEQIEMAITMGRGKMPAFRGVLSPPKIQALVGHVRSLRRSRLAPTPPAPSPGAP
jgi:mono/diheme cytochrome c family protein